MIIELFGPPASGKTTFAHALAIALEKDGFEVELIASSRPAERGSTASGNARALSSRRTAYTAPLRRAAKLIGAARVLLTGTDGDEFTAGLLDLLPPRTLLRWIRCRRLLSLLSHSWETATTSDRIVIFDQGFLTMLCSMALLTVSAERSLLLRGLTLIPRPHLLVRLDAPREVLVSRLQSRLVRQSPVERWFEFDLKTSLEQIEMTNAIVHMLQENGEQMMNVRSLDHRMLEEGLDRIVRRVKSWDRKIGNRSLVERRPMAGAAR
jgi:thymidylate kinase